MLTEEIDLRDSSSRGGEGSGTRRRDNSHWAPKITHLGGRKINSGRERGLLRHIVEREIGSGMGRAESIKMKSRSRN